MDKIDLNSILQTVMKQHILEAMRAARGCKTHAAALLTVKRPILHYHIKKMGLTRKDWDWTPAQPR